MNARDAAKLYIAKNWYPIPLLSGSKACRDSDWLERIYEVGDFGPDDNVGLRLVSASDPRTVKLVGLDLDATECADVFEDLAPPTPIRWGRQSKRISQALYVSPFEKPVVFKDMVSGSTVLEIRVQHQSMAPPSVHPNGEPLFWLDETALKPKVQAPAVPPAELYRAAQLLATAAMIGRHYNPEGARHDWGLALAGVLSQCDLTEDEAFRVITAAATRIAKDPELKDRLDAVRTTYGKGGHVKAGKSLKDLAKGGADFVATLRRIWGGTQQGDFRRNDKDQVIRDDRQNVVKAIDKLGYTLYVDRFAEQGKLVNGTGRPRNLDDTGINRLWFQIDEQFGFRPTKDFFYTAVDDIAEDTPRHPVQEYLADLKWDGEKRIDRWLIEHAGASDSPFIKAISRLFLVAAVRRVRTPGCKFDEMIILEGKQGTGKSSMLRALCPDPDWFYDDLPLDLETKELIERTSGKWIVEVSELSGLRKAGVEHLKGLLSRQVDGPVRMAYGRKAKDRARQFVTIGTTNAFTYLRDATGNRRFWPVLTSSPNPDTIETVRDQLWAEAAVAEAAGEPIRLAKELWEAAGRHQERRRTEDPWEQVIGDAYDWNHKWRLAMDELYDKLGILPALRDERTQDRLVAALQRLQFFKIAIRRGDQVVKGWGRNPRLQDVLELTGEEPENA